MPAVEETATIWVCVDCLMTLANGEPSDDPDYTPDCEPLSQIGDLNVSLGMMWEQHECDKRESWDDEQECGCEHREFSWSVCDGCGSALGGSRDAATIWWEA